MKIVWDSSYSFSKDFFYKLLIVWDTATEGVDHSVILMIGCLKIKETPFFPEIFIYYFAFFLSMERLGHILLTEIACIFW
jgi:hypothetical protein